MRFDITGAGAHPAPTITASDFSTFDVDSHGSPAAADDLANTWTASNIGGSTIAFCATCANGGSKELLIGGPNAGGIYTAGGSLSSHGQKPFIIASGGTYSAPSVLASLDTSPSWVLHFNDINPITPVTISNVTFGFGTGNNYGTDFYTMANHTEYDAPEPESNIMVITGLGLVLLSVAARRARRSRC